MTSAELLQHLRKLYVGSVSVKVWHQKKSVATRALAAALRALAGEE